MTTGLLTGVKIGGSTGAAIFATSQISLEGANISLMVAVPCTVFICGIVWWLGKKFQRIDDKLEYLHRRMDGLPCDNCGDRPSGRLLRK
jgi:hypothetical protein